MFKLNIDKKAIEELISILKKNNLSQIEIKDGKKSIKVAKENIQLQSLSSAVEKQPNEIKNDDSFIQKSSKEIISSTNTIKAPMLGTLYHAPSPKAQPFIKVGKKGKRGRCLVYYWGYENNESSKKR